MVIFKARYDSFGAGMPTASIDGELLQIKENGILELTNINRKLEQFSIFIGRVANHTIEINGQTIALNSLAAPGQSLTFKATKISYINLWKGRKIYGR